MRQGIGLWMKWVGVGGRNQQFSLGHVKFEMSIRSPSGDVEDAVEYWVWSSGKRSRLEI